jgi:hypothetical protein
MATSQHTMPMIIDRLDQPGTARALERVPFDSAKHKEDFIQELIHQVPNVLPVREIEPAFGSLVPVCRELRTQRGRVDNLFVTETGNLAIAECKLWRNPEARRQVVAQVMDYAQAMARWSYADLEKAIRARSDGKAVDGSLISLFGEDSELDEQDFIDAVSRNLRLGRILVLIVGDGIREGVETLARSLQMHAGFHFSLGIIEMALFKLPTGGFLVQPRVLARTVNIERGIVKIIDGQVSIEPPLQAQAKEPRGISEERLWEELEKLAPSTAASLKQFKVAAEGLGLEIGAALKSLQLRWTGPDDVDYALAGITTEGKLKTRNVNRKPGHIGRTDLAHEYLTRLAELIGREVHQADNPRSWYVKGTESQYPEAIDLLSRQEGWLDIIRWYTDELNAAIEGESA